MWASKRAKSGKRKRTADRAESHGLRQLVEVNPLVAVRSVAHQVERVAAAVLDGQARRALVHARRQRHVGVGRDRGGAAGGAPPNPPRRGGRSAHVLQQHGAVGGLQLEVCCKNNKEGHGKRVQKQTFACAVRGPPQKGLCGLKQALARGDALRVCVGTSVGALAYSDAWFEEA